MGFGLTISIKDKQSNFKTMVLVTMVFMVIGMIGINYII